MQGKFSACLLQKGRLYTLDFVIYGFGRVLNTCLPSFSPLKNEGNGSTLKNKLAGGSKWRKRT